MGGGGEGGREVLLNLQCEILHPDLFFLFLFMMRR